MSNSNDMRKILSTYRALDAEKPQLSNATTKALTDSKEVKKGSQKLFENLKPTGSTLETKVKLESMYESFQLDELKDFGSDEASRAEFFKKGGEVTQGSTRTAKNSKWKGSKHIGGQGEKASGKSNSTGRGAQLVPGRPVAGERSVDESQINELSTEKLGDYKKKAAADASAADAKGDFAKGDKRFKGINKATQKQCDQEAKKCDESMYDKDKYDSKGKPWTADSKKKDDESYPKPVKVPAKSEKKPVEENREQAIIESMAFNRPLPLWATAREIKMAEIRFKLDQKNGRIDESFWDKIKAGAQRTWNDPSVDNPDDNKLGDMAARKAKYKANQASPDPRAPKVVDEEEMDEGHYTMPPLNRERYTDVPGLEGPFQTRSGKVVYYDPKEGKYYDRDSDMYIDGGIDQFDEGSDPAMASGKVVYRSPNPDFYVVERGGKFTIYQLGSTIDTYDSLEKCKQVLRDELGLGDDEEEGFIEEDFSADKGVSDQTFDRLMHDAGSDVSRYSEASLKKLLGIEGFTTGSGEFRWDITTDRIPELAKIIKDQELERVAGVYEGKGGYQNWPGEKKKAFYQGPKDKDSKTETQKWAEKKKADREAAAKDKVKEGVKVDRMVGHIKASEKKAGKSDKDAESIAWATANKRGKLDNKNKVDESKPQSMKDALVKALDKPEKKRSAQELENRKKENQDRWAKNPHNPANKKDSSQVKEEKKPFGGDQEKNAKERKIKALKAAHDSTLDPAVRKPAKSQLKAVTEWVEHPQFNKAWDEHVPMSGEAKTFYGEAIRALGRFEYEYFNNGYMNAMDDTRNIDTDDDENDEGTWGRRTSELTPFYQELWNKLNEFLHATHADPDVMDAADNLLYAKDMKNSILKLKHYLVSPQAKAVMGDEGRRDANDYDLAGNPLHPEPEPEMDEDAGGMGVGSVATGPIVKETTSEIDESSCETFQHIIRRFPREVKDFQQTGELSDHLYDALFDYYSDKGEMPYGTAKARDGDPYQWIGDRLERALGFEEGPDVPMAESLNDMRKLAGLI